MPRLDLRLAEIRAEAHLPRERAASPAYGAAVPGIDGAAAHSALPASLPAQGAGALEAGVAAGPQA